MFAGVGDRHALFVTGRGDLARVGVPGPGLALRLTFMQCVVCAGLALYSIRRETRRRRV